MSRSRRSLFRSRVYLDWPAWVRCLQASYRVGDLREFGPANDIEISSGECVASDPDRPPLLIALYPRGDNSHKIDASGLDRLGKRERKNLPHGFVMLAVSKASAREAGITSRKEKNPKRDEVGMAAS